MKERFVPKEQVLVIFQLTTLSPNSKDPMCSKDSAFASSSPLKRRKQNAVVPSSLADENMV